MGGARKLVGNIMDGKLLKGVGPGAWFGLGLNAYFGIDEYRTAKEQGSSTIGAAARAVGEMVIGDIVGMPIYIGTQLATTLPKVAVQAVEGIQQQARSMAFASKNTPFQNATFNDTRQAFTMRQAGMQLAKASKYNLQQTMMGNEAQFLHM